LVLRPLGPEAAFEAGSHSAEPQEVEIGAWIRSGPAGGFSRPRSERYEEVIKAICSAG